jgi:hypothetical protein
MDSLAYYAILGSLIAGAAGTLILLTVAVRQGVWGRGTVGTELAPADRARRHRTIRLADTSALLCFAASAALAIFGVMQQASLATVADAPRDRAEIIARFEAVETRVGLVEAQRQADASAALTAGDRLARLERRIDAGEARVTPAAPRVPKTRVGYATMPAYAVPEPLKGSSTAPSATPTRPLSTPTASDASTTPVPLPTPFEGAAAPEAATPPINHPGLSRAPDPPTTGAAVVAPPLALSMPVAVTPPPPTAKADKREGATSITSQLRRDWEELKRNAREGGWRDALQEIKQLFR